MPCRTQNGKQICTRTDWWREAMGIDWYSGGGSQETDYAALGETLLTTSEKSLAFYEYVNLTGVNGAGISNGNAGLVNRRNPGVNDCVIVGSPVVRELTVNGETVKTLHDEGVNGVSLGHNGESLFNRSFEVRIVYQTSDGQPGTPTPNLLGGVIPTNLGFNVFFRVGADTPPGNIGIVYGNADGRFQYRTTASFFRNDVNGLNIIRIVVDFESDVVKIFNNAIQKAVEQIVTVNTPDAISDVSTGVGKWANTSNIYIGTLNNNGTAISNSSAGSILAVAFSDLLTDDESFNIDAYFYKKYFKWRNEIHIIDSASASATKQLGIDNLFNGNGLPVVAPTIQEGHTGAIHICNSSALSNFDSIDKYTFTFDDVDDFVWTNVAYLIKASTPNGKLLINCQGHISDDVAGHHALMNQALTYGYDVLFVAMPIGSNDNTETNPTVTQQSTAGHDQILTGGLDREGYNPLELYFFEKVSAINLLSSNYSEIYAVGISGGGQSLAWLGMLLNDKIKRSVICRGIALRSFKDDGNASLIEGDYEQGGSLFRQIRCGPRIYSLYSQISYFDLVVSHKNCLLLNHKSDDCCFMGETFAHWKEAAQVTASKIGNKFSQLTLTDPTQATHAYNADDITEIFKHFGHV